MRCASLELKYRKLAGGEKLALMNEFGESTGDLAELLWPAKRSNVATRSSGSDVRGFERRCHYFIKALENLLVKADYANLRHRAVNFLNDVVIPKPLRAEVKHLVAKSHMREGNYKVAPEILKEALLDLRNETQDYSALGITCDLAACYYNLDEADLVEMSIARIEAQLKRHDYAPRIRQRSLNLLGQLYLDRGFFDDSRRCYLESLEEVEDNPSSHEALRLRLYIFGLEKDTGRRLAARLLETRLAGDMRNGTPSDNYDFHRNCAGMRLLEGDVAAARKEYNRALAFCVDNIEQALLRLEWCEKAIAAKLPEKTYRAQLRELEVLAPSCGSTYEWIARSLRAAALVEAGDHDEALALLKQSSAYFLGAHRFHDLDRDLKNILRVSPRTDEGASLIELAAHLCSLAASADRRIPLALAHEAKKILREPLPVDASNRLYLDVGRELLLDESKNTVIDFREQPLLWRLLRVFTEKPAKAIGEPELVAMIWGEQHFNASHPPKIRRALNRLKIKFNAAGIRLSPVSKTSQGYRLNAALGFEVLKSS